MSEFTPEQAIQHLSQAIETNAAVVRTLTNDILSIQADIRVRKSVNEALQLRRHNIELAMRSIEVTNGPRMSHLSPEDRAEKLEYWERILRIEMTTGVVTTMTGFPVGKLPEGEPEPESGPSRSVELRVAGYEWDCPDCDSLNEGIEICDQVECGECGATFSTDQMGVTHATEK